MEMEVVEVYEGANFYAICPSCNEPIAFQGVDIEYYKPIGSKIDKPIYSEQTDLVDTGKVVACPYCKKVSKAKDFKFIINDF